MSCTRARMLMLALHCIHRQVPRHELTQSIKQIKSHSQRIQAHKVAAATAALCVCRHTCSLALRYSLPLPFPSRTFFFCFVFFVESESSYIFIAEQIHCVDNNFFSFSLHLVLMVHARTEKNTHMMTLCLLSVHFFYHVYFLSPVTSVYIFLFTGNC